MSKIKIFFITFIIALMIMPVVRAVPGQYDFHYHIHATGSVTKITDFPYTSAKDFNFTMTIVFDTYNSTSDYAFRFSENHTDPTTLYDVGATYANVTAVTLDAHDGEAGSSALITSITVKGQWVNATGTYSMTYPAGLAASSAHVDGFPDLFSVESVTPCHVDIWLYSEDTTTTESMMYLIYMFIPFVIVMKIMKKR